MTETSAAGIPQGVSRFNWGAFFFPVLWPLFYGMYGWGLVAFLNGIILQLLGVNLTQSSPVALVVGVNVLALGIEFALRVYFGLKLTSAYWSRYPERLTPEDYRRRQSKWVILGMVAMALSVALNVYVFQALR